MNIAKLTIQLLGVPLAAALTLTSAGSAQAQPYEYEDAEVEYMAEDDADQPNKAKKRNKRRGKGKKLCKRLNCTPEQSAKIAEIKENQRKQSAEHKAEIKQLRRQLELEFKADRLNKRAVNRIFAKIQDHREAMAELQRDTLAEIHPILTPEQRERFARQMNRKPNHGPRKNGKGKGKGKRKGKGKNRHNQR